MKTMRHLLLVAALLFAGPVVAAEPQPGGVTIVLKDGKTVTAPRLRRAGSSVMVPVEIGTGTGEVGYPVAHIARIEFPEPPEIKHYCKKHPSPLANVLRVGIGLLGEGKQIAEEGMMGELSKENGKMQTWISYLSVIGVCTPMIGLLGTVTGMIKAFATLGSSGIGDPSSLSAAIGEVLVATASGLFIAIPAFGAYYYLRNRASDAMHRIQDTVASLFRKMPYEALAGVHIGDDEPMDSPTSQDLPQLKDTLMRLKQNADAAKTPVIVTILSEELAKYSRTVDVLDALAVARIDSVSFTVTEEDQ